MGKMSFFVFFLCFPFCLFAQFFYTPPFLEPYIEDAPEIICRAAVMIDAATGTMIFSKNPNEEIPPASLSKLMTMHLVMKEIEAGRASYDEIIPITAESWAQSQPPRSSLMFLEPGQTVTLREILLGLAVSSGNDAAVAAALRITHSMDDFANLMTNEARRMGLNVTRFVEASGYSNQNITTANEFAYFCYQYIRIHPNSMRDFHSIISFSYPLAENEVPRHQAKPRTITQESQNSLLKNFPGADGLKTGYIGDSGFNIAVTAERDNNRFLLVLLGAPSHRSGRRIRDADASRLLSWAFDNFKTVRPQEEELAELQTAKLWKGREKTARLKPAYSMDFTSSVNRANKLEYRTVINNVLIAPLPENYTAGYIVISDEYGELNRVPLVTASALKKGNIFRRIWHSILLFFA